MSLSTYSNLLKFIKNHDIKYIALDFRNIFLYEDLITINSTEFSEEIYNKGLKIHIKETKFSDHFDKTAKIKPDFNSFFIDPFATQNTLIIMSDIIVDDHHTISPRIIAKSVIKKFINKTNIKDIHFQPTINFYIFDNVELKKSSTISYHKLYTGDENLNNLRSEICNTLNDIGINVFSHYSKNNIDNLCNFQLSPIPLEKSHDQVYITKYIAKKVAQSYGKKLTFMPLPLDNQYPIETSLFFNFSDKVNLDQDAIEKCFSKTFIKAFTNPTTNSFKRIQLHGDDQKKCSVYSNKVNIKFADSTADPYLSLSTILLCFADYFSSSSKSNTIDNLKCKKETLGKALKSLDKNREFFIKSSDNIISNEFLSHYINLKRKELLFNSTTPTTSEIATYFDI